MAYMGRGGFSSFKGVRGSSNNSGFRSGNNGSGYYRHGHMYYYRYPMSRTGLLMTIILVLIILVTMGVAYLTAYKSDIIDPIETTKNIILWTHGIIVIFLFVMTIIASFTSEDKSVLIRKLSYVLFFTIITLITFFGIKLYMDTTYTESKFSQIYQEEYMSTATSKNINGSRNHFVNECINLYQIYSIKTYVIIAGNSILLMILIYLISRASKSQTKMDRLSKDDAVLFDEEENVKI